MSFLFCINFYLFSVYYIKKNIVTCCYFKNSLHSNMNAAFVNFFIYYYFLFLILWCLHCARHQTGIKSYLSKAQTFVDVKNCMKFTLCTKSYCMIPFLKVPYLIGSKLPLTVSNTYANLSKLMFYVCYDLLFNN